MISFDKKIVFTFEQAIDYMTIVEQKFREKRFYERLFSGMWFNQHELSLPEGLLNRFSHLKSRFKPFLRL
jgi:hypothetical protein